MHRRLLIVNADDFGLSAEVNEAVILAHRRGILTSTSLMTSEDAFANAVALAKENPSLSVGIHVTCAHGKSVLPKAKIPHIVDGNGHFPSDPAYAGLKYFFCKKARKELFTEVEAQFEKFCKAGLNFSHMDSHCHLHVHPVLLEIMLQMGEQYGIKRIRVPDDDFFAALPFLGSPLGKAGYAVVFKLLSARMRSILRKRGFRFPGRTYGNVMTGSLNREYVLSLLERVPQGVSEIYFHPAIPADGSQPDRQKTQLLRELNILLDAEVSAKMKKLGIVPAAYKDLDAIQ